MKFMTDYRIGDCFLFKESINDFGLVLLEIHNLPEGQWYDLFPVKLDRTKSGLDQFTHGDVYLVHQAGTNNSEEVKEGFMVIAFQNENNFESIDKLLNYIDSLKIKKQYVHATGVTAAEEYWQFEVVFEQWDQIFGFDTETTTTQKIKLIDVLE